MRQQARSSVLSSALGTMQAIAGARYDTKSRTSTPNWRRIRIPSLDYDSLPKGANSFRSGTSVTLGRLIMIDILSCRQQGMGAFGKPPKKPGFLDKTLKSPIIGFVRS
jgi:hypothetical protein